MVTTMWGAPDWIIKILLFVAAFLGCAVFVGFIWLMWRLLHALFG
jgi:hypothetical protein